MVNEEDLKLQLLAGLPIKIDDFGYIYPLTMKQIIEIGESEYNKILSYLLIDKDNMKEIQDEEISNLELMIIQSYYNEDFKTTILNGLQLFTRKDIAISQDGFFYFINKDGKTVILNNKESFNQIQHVLKKANLIKQNKDETYNPANERTKKFIQKMMKNKQKQKQQREQKKNKDIDLHSIISGVTWKGNTNISNVLNLTIYQLYDAFYRLENIDNYHYTLTGIYAGTVDGKKINLKNINWAKVQNNF